MYRCFHILMAIVVFASVCLISGECMAEGEGKVLKPHFEKTGHVSPKPTQPLPRSNSQEYTDLALLVLALVVSGYLSLKKRSRRGIVLLTILCLLYFGFWRKGCVCSVGSIQNIATALFDKTYAVPFVVLAFFAIPLLFTLFFGRTFCAAVCPLGAIQELVILKPIKLPAWLSHMLGMFPYIYLGLAVTLAACGGGYIICRQDPFIGFFRFGASFPMLVFGACVLVLGVFIARPYCRFMCPYGVLLGWASRLAKTHVTITPEECIHCRLCEESCPFDAIVKPLPEKAIESRAVSVRRIIVIIALFPLLLVGGGWMGSKLAPALALSNRTVVLAEQVMAENSGEVDYTTLDSETFRESGDSEEILFENARLIKRKLRTGGWFMGGFWGLVFGCTLIRLSIRWKRYGHEPDRGKCFSCARCFSYCPKEMGSLTQSSQRGMI